MVLTGILQSYLLCRHVSDQRKIALLNLIFLPILMIVIWYYQNSAPESIVKCEKN